MVPIGASLLAVALFTMGERPGTGDVPTPAGLNGPAVSAAPGESKATERYAISVAEPLRFVLDKRAALRTHCRTSKPIAGCTMFADETLSCACESDGSRWHIVARAQFVPVMFLYARRMDVVDHERLHIDDLHAKLARHLEDLTAREFATEERCARKVESEERGFLLLMNGFRRKSNDELD